MTARPARQPVATGALGAHVVAMTGTDKEREERLAAALRENLRKRKAQAREAETRQPKPKP